MKRKNISNQLLGNVHHLTSRVGGYGFFQSKYFFPLRSAAEYFFFQASLQTEFFPQKKPPLKLNGPSLIDIVLWNKINFLNLWCFKKSSNYLIIGNIHLSKNMFLLHSADNNIFFSSTKSIFFKSKTQKSAY